jgi:hypothetical protein
MAMATIPETQRPTHRERRHARELARMQRARILYQRPSTPPATNDDSAWYARWLAYAYTPAGWEG